MTEEKKRSLEVEIEVVGTPEQVWRAIATGPGITSWYVPHTVEECEGGAASASFGAGPEMQIAGRVAAWEPPRRVVFDGGEGVEGLAFEWLVEARDEGTCVVRLVNSGFGVGAEWDGQYDAMHEGWLLFLLNLKLHLQYFGGQSARASLPMATWAGSPSDAWIAVTTQLGIVSQPAVGDRLSIAIDSGAALGGVVADVGPRRIALIVEEPAPGTAFLAAESAGELAGVSLWSYLYGPAGDEASRRDEPKWAKWLADRAVTEMQIPPD